jgi:hypothetical protein
VAFNCLDSRPDLIQANETQREGNLNRDDEVLIAIDSQKSRRNLSVFHVSARGTQSTEVEGGTADNVTWAGDWKAAVQRTPTGWTAEISIPFALMRYPRGTRSFPLLLARKIARETNLMSWPYVPLGGERDVAQHMHDFDGFEPPDLAPRPVFLPYALGSTGDRTIGRMGLDVKYPLTTTMTGVATLFPDFQTVEQAVRDISFSYTERYVPDRRPFFAEGRNFLPDPFIFYSQRIQQVDAGLKVVGKEGPTTVGLLTTTSQAQQGQSAFVLGMNRDLGAYSRAGINIVANNEEGKPANRVAQFAGRYGWRHRQRQVNISGDLAGSWLPGKSDHNAHLSVSTDAGKGKPEASAFYTETRRDFVNQLGLVYNTDQRGAGINVGQSNDFDRGAVERYYIGVNADSFRRMTGGFFRDSVALFGYVGMRSGWGYNLGVDAGKRDAFHDNTASLGVSWGNRPLFQGGGFNVGTGRRADQPYRYYSLSQGLLITRPFSMRLNHARYTVGRESSTQTVLSGVYQLSSERTVGGRLVQQNGDTNLYFSFGQHVRAGYDLYLLIGDPNSPRTRGTFTLKLVTPFSPR